ncbi:MAG TPA: LysR family transcriptional regulator [Casimicrobiaceae bacterium]|nr:LysR family transcriptional regulator [Casimicrobiaceae bacterium]
MIFIVFNLRRVDLNLLPIFEAAYEERSLSRAADRLALTQPAVSHALSRLRALFADELFIRRSRGVQPTPAADRIYARLRGGLAAVRAAVVESRGFDPATSERQFVVSIPHPLGPMMAVRLRERLARAAPHARIAFSTRSRPVDQERGLREGRIDAAIDWLVPAGTTLSESVVFDDGLLVMARRGNPALRYRKAEQVARAAEFVALRPRIEGEHPVPALREWQRMSLRVALEVSEFVEVLMVAGGSDLLAPVPFSMERLARGTFELRAVTAMRRIAPVPIRMIWHPARDRDPAHAFLRTELAQAVGDVAGGR